MWLHCRLIRKKYREQQGGFPEGLAVGFRCPGTNRSPFGFPIMVTMKFFLGL